MIHFRNMKPGPIKRTVELQLRAFMNDLEAGLPDNQENRFFHWLIEDTMKEWGIRPKGYDSLMTMDFSKHRNRESTIDTFAYQEDGEDNGTGILPRKEAE